MAVYPNDPWAIVVGRIKPLLPVFQIGGVTEIAVNRFDDVWYNLRGWKKAEGVGWRSEEEVKALIKQIAHALGQEVIDDELDAHFARSDDPEFPLPNGARINATLAPTAIDGSTLNIRLFPKVTYTEQDLLQSGTYTPDQLKELKEAVARGDNILVSGATGSGKTTLLNVLAAMLNDGLRIVTVEDTRELSLKKPNYKAFEAVRKKGETVGFAERLTSALRKTPDRIIAGEIRTSKAADVFRMMMNTGHRGCMSTTHANSGEDAVERVVNLVMGSENAKGIPYHVLEGQIRRNIDLVVHMEAWKVMEILPISVRPLPAAAVQQGC